MAKRLGVKRRDHHRWVSHSFAGWIGPTVLALALARGTRRAGARAPLRGRRCGCHLLLDTYADGIAWLWPYAEEKIGLFRKPPEIVDHGWSTPAPLDTELGRAEAAMWAAVAPRDRAQLSSARLSTASAVSTTSDTRRQRWIPGRGRSREESPRPPRT